MHVLHHAEAEGGVGVVHRGVRRGGPGVDEADARGQVGVVDRLERGAQAVAAVLGHHEGVVLPAR